jgi:RimJ/RimL family protein N-acetyltransferase
MQREDLALSLRQPTQHDLPALYELHADPRTNAFNPRGPMASMEAAQELLDALIAHWSVHGFGYWMVSLPDAPDDVLGIGGLAEKRIPGRSGLNLYYRFRPEAWGRGLATATARRAIGFACDTLARGDELFARVRPDNLPSIGVLERSGLVHSGHTPDPALGDDPWLLYTLPEPEEDDWLQPPQPAARMLRELFGRRAQ